MRVSVFLGLLLLVACSSVNSSPTKELNDGVEDGEHLSSFYRKLQSVSSLSKTLKGWVNKLTQKQTPGSIKVQQCRTEDCQAAAKLLKSSMNPRVNPCEDFYEFSCGSYAAKKKLEKNQLMSDVFDDQEKRVQEKLVKIFKSDVQKKDLLSLQKMKKFYQACVNEDQSKTIDFVKNVLKKAGGWPVVEGKNWSEKDYNISKIYQQLESNLFKVNFPAVLSNVHIEIFFSMFGISTVPSIDAVFPGDLEKSTQSMKDKLEKMIELAVLFGADPEIARKDMYDMMQFESHIVIAKQLSTVVSQKKTNKRQLVSRSYLHSNLSWVPHWDQMFNVSLAPFLDNDSFSAKLLNNLQIFIKDPDFVPEFEYILNNTSKRVQANYMFYSALLSKLEYLIHDLKTPLKVTSQDTKESFCLKRVQIYFNKAVALTYLKNYATPQSIKATRDITENIKAQYLKEMIKVSYPEVSVKNVTNFYNTLEIIYGYDDRASDAGFIENYYSELDTDKNSFYEAMMEATKFVERKKKESTKEDRKNNDDSSILSNLVANAYFNIETKKIGLSVPIMEPPFMSPKFPASLNYGRFGFIFAHELAHGLLLNPLYDLPRTYENEQCIVDQYGEIVVDDAEGKTLDGLKTKDENLADNAGIRVAYQAYLTEASRPDFYERGLPGLNYTPEQLFWISSASAFCQKIDSEHREEIMYSMLNDVHTPPEVRFNAAFANSKEFSRDFQCKLGSRMNPVKKCDGVRR